MTCRLFREGVPETFRTHRSRIQYGSGLVWLLR
jgi:hypothetical protein